MERVVVKHGWWEAGREGVLLTTVMCEILWGVVLWDGDDDPSLYKYRGLTELW